MEPRAGTLVTPNLRLVRPLGKGGMGSVWVAEHLTLESEVAVKFIAAEHRHRERSVQRFAREASSAARIRSPHVVTMFDHGVGDEGTPYIVMELLQGESLAARLSRGERLSSREAVLLVSQVAKVLDEAHALDIVHRDLKPDNLFLVDSGYELFVKVLDFGIAKRRNAVEPDSLTDSGTMVGTPYYMSPEALMSSRDVDHQADLWSLAVVAYHALTGRVPFSGETFAALSVAIHEGRFAPASSLVPALDGEVDAWFKLALCRKPEHRFATASELASAFRKAMAGVRDEGADALPDTARAPRVEVAAVGRDHETSALPGEGLALDTTVSSDEGPGGERLSGTIHATTVEGPSSVPPRAAARWPIVLGLLAVSGAAVIAAGLRDDAPAKAPADNASQAAEPQEAAATQQPSGEAPPRAAPPPPPPADASQTRTPPRAAPIARAPVAAPRPSTSPVASASATARAIDCSQPFTTNEHGDLVPRPECFAR